MIKERVYLIGSWQDTHGYVTSWFGNYAHNTYLFGILISSVTVGGVKLSEADRVFGDKLVK